MQGGALTLGKISSLAAPRWVRVVLLSMAGRSGGSCRTSSLTSRTEPVLPKTGQAVSWGSQSRLSSEPAMVGTQVRRATSERRPRQ